MRWGQAIGIINHLHIKRALPSWHTRIYTRKSSVGEVEEFFVSAPKQMDSWAQQFCLLRFWNVVEPEKARQSSLNSRTYLLSGCKSPHFIPSYIRHLVIYQQELSAKEVTRHAKWAVESLLSQDGKQQEKRRELFGGKMWSLSKWNNNLSMAALKKMVSEIVFQRK